MATSIKKINMKAKINSKMRMYASVLEVCKQHESTWAVIPGFVTSVNEFETVFNTLRTKAGAQSTVLLGVTASKNSALGQLYERLLILHDALWIHGNVINDAPLKARNKFTISGIQRLSTYRLDAHLLGILDDLNSHGSFLGEYGVSAEFISETTEMVQEVRLSFTRPRMAIIEKKALTKSLDELSFELDNILKFRLDKIMRLFKNAAPGFYSLYFSARIIIDLKGKSTGVAPPEPEGES